MSEKNTCFDYELLSVEDSKAAITTKILFNHNMHAPNKNLYDPFFVDAGEFVVPYNWFVEYANNNGDMDGIFEDAVADGVMERPFLWYLRNRTIDDVALSTTKNLLHDAYYCRTLVADITGKEAAEKGEKFAEEFNALMDLRHAIEGELVKRLSAIVDVDKDIEDDCCYIEFLHVSSIDKVRNMRLSDMYKDLYSLYEFFDNVKEPKKKAAKKEYEFCGKIRKEFERNIFKRLTYFTTD